MIKYFLLALCTGIIVTLFVAQQDEWVKHNVGEVFKHAFEDSLGCVISFTVKKINFFIPELVLENVLVQPVNAKEGWSWRCNTYHTWFSWIHLFGSGSIDMRVALDGFKAQSEIINKNLAIMLHIRELLKGPTFKIPTFLKALVLKKARFTIVDSALNPCAFLQWNSSSLKIGNLFKTSMYVNDAELTIKNRRYCKSGSGSMHIEIAKTKKGTLSTVHVDMSLKIPQLDVNDSCFLTGVWKNNHGRFSLHSVHNTVLFDPIIITDRNGASHAAISGHFPLSLACLLLHNGEIEKNIDGTCSLSLKARLDKPESVDGHLVIEDVTYKQIPICDAVKCTFTKRNMQWKGNVSLRGHASEFTGSWWFCENSMSGNMHVINNTIVRLPRTFYWSVLPRDLLLRLTMQSDGIIKTSYQCKATNRLRQATFDSQGDVVIQQGQFNASGSVNKQRYELQGDISPVLQLHSCKYYNEDNKPLITLTGQYQNKKTLGGVIDYRLIRSLIKQITDFDLQGEGAVQAHGSISSDQINLQLQLDDATIRLPQTYNFIDGFKAVITYDIEKYALTMKHMYCSLHTGNIYSPHAVVLFDNAGICTFAHIPLQINRCLLNVKKDLFAMISGNVLLHYKKGEKPLLKGNIFIDRAQLKENLLSDTFQKQLSQYTGNMFSMPGAEIVCDISIETKSPIRIDTYFLHTNAKVNLRAQNNIKQPVLTGSISLLGGSLIFPYKPLHITKGGIYFMAEHSYDPMIELVARNTIKKYNVALHVTGSLCSHHVILDATPPLSEEQIIALLLIGSEQESLNTMMPALIVQNLKQVIFGSNQSSLLDKYFNPLFKPFNIHLVPSFTDQSGRGGLRGTLEIDVNDRWSALIQKNFSLSEDTRFELEYLLSDDISLRGIRDERRDMGGEIEVRWKF